tara:strand:- start:91 stop:459 length:369 start_codon:yes stop_codon:yes gene_type:complete
MSQAVSTVLIKKYATFNGRAGLSEYWWFILFLTLGNLVFSGLDSYLGTTAGFMYQGNIEIKTSLFNGIFSLLTFIPSIAVAARRLHDVNKSGWWQLLMLTIIGIFPLVYWLLKKPVDKGNRF